MPKIIIDIVIIPDEEMAKKVRAINRQLREEGSDYPVMGLDKTLPHISLVMGAIEEKDLDEVEKVIYGVVENKTALQLEALGIGYNEFGKGEFSSQIDVDRGSELIALQKEVMKAVWSFISFESLSKEMLFEPLSDGKGLLDYVEGFRDKYGSPEKFHPHITLGSGKCAEDALGFPFVFTASRIAICHLGDFCTCAKVFRDIKLNS